MNAALPAVDGAAATRPVTPAAAVWLNDAFISYSRHDRAFAVLLEKALKSYRPPPGIAHNTGQAQRHLSVFRDESDFTGTEYYAAIDAQLRQSRKLILLCSPAARSSRFVDDEVRRFIAARSSADVIPLLLSGAPNNEAGPEQAAQMAFPQALCDALQMPLATSYLGFDAKRDKPAKDRFEGAWYTLLANLYEVRRSEIEDRDRKRQARQRNVLGAVAAAVIVALLAALAFALMARNEAVKQRDLAEQQRRAAHARQLNVAADVAQAEGIEGARLSLLLGIESLRIDWTAEAHAAMLSRIDGVLRPPSPIGSPHQFPVRAIAVTSDGAWVASASEDATVVRDRSTGTEVQRLPPSGRGPRLVLAFSLDRRWLVAGCKPAAACVWDTRTWTIAAPLERAELMQAAAFSADGQWLASVAFGSGQLQWRRTSDWQVMAALGVDKVPSEERISGIALHPSGRWLATQQGKRVALWDLGTRRQLKQIDAASSVGGALAFSPDGRWLSAMGTAGGLALWRFTTAATGAPQLTAEPHWQTPQVGWWTTPVFSQDGTRVAFGPKGGGISVFAMASGKETHQIAQREAAFTRVLAFDPLDAGNLIVGAADGTLAAWSLDTPEALRLPHPGVASRLALSADGRWVAAIDSERIVRVFERNSGRRVAQLAFVDERAELSFSADGRWLLLTDAQGALVIDTRSWTQVLQQRVERWPGAQLRVTPDGAWFVVAGNGQLRRWATGSWQLAAPIALHTEGGFDDFFLSPDGKQLAAHSGAVTGGRGQGLKEPSMTRVWDIAAGGEALGWVSYEAEDMKKNEGLFGGFRASGASGVWTKASSGGAPALARASLNWTRLPAAGDVPQHAWLTTRDAREQTLAQSMLARARRAHGGGARAEISSAFSADGRWLATSGQDGSLRLWLVAPPDLVADACGRSARNLNGEEWQRNFGTEAYRLTCPALPPPTKR